MTLLRTIRHQRGLSITQLAIMADLSPTTVYNFEKDSHRPHISTVIQLAKALDIRVSEIDTPKSASHLGKPAQSGGRSSKCIVKKYGPICKDCNTEKPLSATHECYT